MHSELGSDVIEGGVIIIEHKDNDGTAGSLADASVKYGSVFAHPQFADKLYGDGCGLAAT